MHQDIVEFMYRSKALIILIIQNKTTQVYHDYMIEQMVHQEFLRAK